MSLREPLGTFLHDFAGLPQDSAEATGIFLLLLLLAFASWLSGALCKRFVSPLIRHLAQRTPMEWDDILLDHRVLNALFSVVPGVLFYQLQPHCFPPGGTGGYSVAQTLVERGAAIYVAVTFVLLASRLLSQFVEVADRADNLKVHHVVGVVQFVKLIVYCVGGIVVTAFIFGRNPVHLIAGLGAAATVLMLIFRDSILGLVAGIQLSANNMLKPGDWISIERLGVDGIVENISLTTVKIRNFDHSVSTVPPYTLVSDVFRNWEGMFASGRRRVKRSLRIDIDSIRFCSAEEVAGLERLHLLAPAYADDGQRPVNLRLFRLYAENYLRRRPDVAKGRKEASDAEPTAPANVFGWIMARQLEPTPDGLPIEFFFYLDETDFSRYEALAADCMEHLIATLPAFGLRVFQHPAGRDLRNLRA